MIETNEQSRILELLRRLCDDADDDIIVRASRGGTNLTLTRRIGHFDLVTSWPHPSAASAARSGSMVRRLRERLACLIAMPVDARRRNTPDGVAETWDVTIGTPPCAALLIGLHGTEANAGDVLILSPPGPGFDLRLSHARHDDPDIVIDDDLRRITDLVQPFASCVVTIREESAEFHFKAPILRSSFPSDPLEIMRAHSELHDLLHGRNASR